MTALREFDRIRQVIEQNLLQANRVAMQCSGQCRVDFRRQPKPLVAGFEFDHLQHVAEQTAGGEIDLLQAELVGLYF